MALGDFVFGPVLRAIDALADQIAFLTQRQEVYMSATQQKLDELKGVQDTLVGKVTELSADFKALLGSMQEAKDDPAELQVLIDKGNAMTATIDDALAAANPTPPPTP